MQCAADFRLQPYGLLSGETEQTRITSGETAAVREKTADNILTSWKPYVDDPDFLAKGHVAYHP